MCSCRQTGPRFQLVAQGQLDNKKLVLHSCVFVPLNCVHTQNMLRSPTAIQVCAVAAENSLNGKMCQPKEQIYCAAQHSTAQHERRSTAQHERHSTAHQGTAWHRKHSTAWHSAAQHNTAAHLAQCLQFLLQLQLPQCRFSEELLLLPKCTLHLLHQMHTLDIQKIVLINSISACC